MTHKARNIADSFAAGLFAISTALTALRTSTVRPELHTERALMDGAELAFAAPAGARGGLNLLGLVSQPSNAVLWALLVAVIVATGAHALGRLRRPMPSARERADTIGFLLGAAWPWVLNPAPLTGLALAGLSVLLLTRGIVRHAGGTAQAHGDLPVAFVAGWLLVAASSALGMYLHLRMGMGLESAILAGLLVTALLGARVQLKMDGGASFSLAIIWAMIGFAAATAGTSITIATACVLGISALAVVLVRVTT